MSAQGKPAAAAGTALGWADLIMRPLKGCMEFGKSTIPEGSPKIAHRFNGGKAIVVQIYFS